MSIVSRKEFLKLYKDIFTAHRKNLPSAMRFIGDSYVREEWGLHKEIVNSQQIHEFYKNWKDYLETIQKSKGALETIGLTETEIANMSTEQKDQLAKLKEETTKLGKEN